MTALQRIAARVRDRLVGEHARFTWRRLLAPLRAAKPEEPVGTILFCDLMTMAASAKVEALIAGLVRLKGYRPLVLLESPNWSVEWIFRAAAPETEFIYRAGDISEEEQAEARKTAAAIMAKHGTLQSLVNLNIDGFRIGRNVQSKVLRKFRVGRLDDSDPKHHEEAFETLVCSLGTKAFVQRLLKDRSVDIAVFVERGYTPAGEVFDGCILAGVDVVQWCGAPQSDCLIYRRYNVSNRGEHPLALSDETWQRLLEMPWSDDEDRMVAERIAANYKSGAWYNRQQLQEGKRVLAAEKARQALSLDASKKTAVIFCHILYDATFFYGESLFEDYEQWLVETVRAAIANPQLNWIVKVHPVNVWRSKMDGSELIQLEAETLRRNFGTLPDHVKIMSADTDINTFSLFDVADYGLTVRGTIGMELPCFGIPVVSAGTGRYSGRGFTIDPKTRDEYFALLANLQEIVMLDRETIRRARLHYYGALSLRPVPMKSFLLDYRSSNGNGEPQPDVILHNRADASLMETEDLGRLTHWMLDSRSPELLAAGYDVSNKCH
jgi:hypothetical protein